MGSDQVLQPNERVHKRSASMVHTLFAAPVAPTLVLSSTGLVPTSMMAAPGLIQLPRTSCAWPAAAITMSAERTMDSISCGNGGVAESQDVTTPGVL